MKDKLLSIIRQYGLHRVYIMFCRAEATLAQRGQERLWAQYLQGISDEELTEILMNMNDYQPKGTCPNTNPFQKRKTMKKPVYVAYKLLPLTIRKWHTMGKNRANGFSTSEKGSYIVDSDSFNDDTVI